MFKEIKRLFGERFGIRVINDMSMKSRDKIKSEVISLSPITGSLVEEESIRVRSNHHSHSI